VPALAFHGKHQALAFVELEITRMATTFSLSNRIDEKVLILPIAPTSLKEGEGSGRASEFKKARTAARISWRGHLEVFPPA
jgi:hypothetical protein